ncbi:60S acidic ribosomal protein P1 [Chytridiales sp. JEL 0842]|nr:60S acidic ribosomal protein P1 [Chytridiales sp. JEL 0842]
MSLSTTDAALVYAALVLHDDGLEITADKLTSLIEAAGIEIEPIWPTLFAKAVAGKDIGALIFNVGAGAPAAAAPAAAAPAAGGAPAAAASKKEEKKEEKEESDDDMGFGLFD